MTMIDRRFPPDEEHRSEPEIIPPGRAYGSEPESTFWVRDVERGSRRIYVAKIGRFGLLPFFLLGGYYFDRAAHFCIGRFFGFDSRGGRCPRRRHNRRFAARISALAALISPPMFKPVASRLIALIGCEVLARVLSRTRRKGSLATSI